MSDKRSKIEKAVIREGVVVKADSPKLAALATEQMQRARARAERRREVWGTDNREQIQRLALSFPTLRDALGLDPWDPHEFLAWALSPSCTSGGWQAALFVLSVWNSSVDWACVARELGLLRDAPELNDTRSAAVELGLVDDRDYDAGVVDEDLIDRAHHAVETSRNFTFQVSRAFGVWDAQHQEAFLQWCHLPFFP